jgi:hypothetical protein
MRRETKIAALALACTVGIALIQSPGNAQSAAEQIKSTQEEWLRCLKDAYPSYARKTPSQNYAADMTFQACSANEEKLWTFLSESGVSRSAFEKIKAATKKSFVSAK